MTSADIAVATKTLTTDGADVVYDVRGPLPTADGRPPLFLVGQPMDAGGFSTLVTFFPDRTVLTYDPRGGAGERTRRDDESAEVRPEDQADDLHAIIGQVGGQVDVFASSGGAVTALALVARYPQDVATLVAHEPPLLTVLPDAEVAEAAYRRVMQTYQDRGWGAGMAAFVAFTSTPGEFTEDFLAAPLPDPAMFGMPAEDDGSRGDPLLSGVADPVPLYRPDFAAIRNSPTRVVPAAGVESRNLMTWRTTEAVAAELGVPLAEFPSHHGGFMGGEGGGYAGQPEAFAGRLREVLDRTS